MLLTYRLIKNHEGKISFNSTENVGSSFQLTFPIKSNNYQYKSDSLPQDVSSALLLQENIDPIITEKENSEAPLPTYCPQKSLTPGYSSPSHNTTSALYPPRVTLGFHVSSYEPLLFLRQCPQCWVWGGEQHSLYFCYLVRNGKSQNLRWGNFIPRACANSCKSPMWKLLWSVLNYTSCLTLGGSFIFPLK